MKECWGCGNYQAYYTKGYYKYDRKDRGNCTKHEKIVGKHESCGQWRTNAVRRRVRKSICLNALGTAISNLSEMKQILSEEREESKINPI